MTRPTLTPGGLKAIQFLCPGGLQMIKGLSEPLCFREGPWSSRLLSSGPERCIHVLTDASRYAGLTYCNHPLGTLDDLSLHGKTSSIPGLTSGESLRHHRVFVKMMLAAIKHKPPKLSGKIPLFIYMKYNILLMKCISHSCSVQWHKEGKAELQST